MPMPPPIYSETFYQPFTQDVEELLARFQLQDSVRYQDFASIWRDMSFADVFVGLMGDGEMRRFGRVAAATAVKYFLSPYSYQIRVGALYLMFALFHSQPSVPPVKIRLALKDWEQVQTFLAESTEAGHHDVVYVYRKLVSAKAFHYGAMPHLLTYHKQKKTKKEQEQARSEFLGRAAAVRDLFSSDLLEELANVQGHYHALREQVEEVKAQVGVTMPDLASRLRDCMTDFLTWQEQEFSEDNKEEVKKKKKKREEEEEEQEEEDEAAAAEASSSRAKLLSDIKKRSYGAVQDAPRSRRHRQAELAQTLGSGAEPGPEEGRVTRRRPPSLKARTTQTLKVQPEGSKTNYWLLTAPLKQDD